MRIAAGRECRPKARWRGLSGILCWLACVAWLGLRPALGLVTQGSAAWNARDYHGIPEKDKHTLFLDEFEDNRHDWSQGTAGHRVGRVVVDHFYWQTLTDQAGLTWRTVGLDQTSDFEIEAVIKSVSGKGTGGNYLLWGMSTEADYEFGFSSDGESYRIAKDVHGGKEGDVTYVAWTDDDALVRDQGTYNTLTVRKVAGRYYFFLNERLVHTMPFVSFAGHRVGFQTSGRCVIHVDSLRIAYLAETGARNPYRYTGVTAEEKRRIFFDEFEDNGNKWSSGTKGQRLGKVEADHFHWETLTDSVGLTWRTIAIDQAKDFEIEAAIKSARSKPTTGNYLLWGMGKNADYEFGFSSDGESYRIARDQHGGKAGDVTYMPWRDALHMVNDQGAYNKLTVRKIGDRYYFFLNEFFAGTTPFESFAGDRIGFQVSGNSVMHVDYLRISYIGPHRRRPSTTLAATPRPQPRPQPEPYRPAPPQPRPSGVTGTGWAVVVGISRYHDSRVPALRYASADAKAFHDWLVSPQGGRFAPARVKLLLDQDATGRAIRGALFSWLKRALAEDFVVIYFAGHGSPDAPDTPENLFLLPYDADHDDVATTGFPMWDVRTALTRFIKAKKVVIIADACHSGGVGKSFSVGRRGSRGLKANAINAGLQSLTQVGDGICVLSASDDKQLSQESAQWGGGHGVFTHYLLQGLNGGADYNGDARVSLGELIPYISEQVRRSTANAQSPVVSGKFDPALSFGR